ncbi:FMN-dependent NADH-azoreductase [Achromobacter sp. NPDC058515]|uniref:FMN-dependent NADH-azoreductase n=1 Tax=Achromobacter sp. NPDC058515 TaxID=3346533 RepID=UPI00365C3B79
MNILRIICSPRGRASESYRLSQRLVDRLCASFGSPGPRVTDLDAAALPHVDRDYAAALSAPMDPSAEILGRGALRQSGELIDALQNASHIVIATPMHNFTVPSSLKVWIDHVVRVRSTFKITPEGKVGTLADRPVYVAISSGGEFSGDAARQPDFLTPYLKHVLGTIGLHDVTFFTVEGTARGDEALRAARARAEARIAAHAFTANARAESLIA